MIKIMMHFFSNMNYGVYYYLIKFQLKTPSIHGEMKKTNLLGSNLNQRT